MAITVNPDAGIPAPDTSREEAIYAFRFDLDNDAREELTSKVRLGAVTNRWRGPQALPNGLKRAAPPGTLRCAGRIANPSFAGHTSEVANGDAGVMVFAGRAPDLFAGDAAALGFFRNAFFNEGKIRTTRVRKG